MTKIYSEIVVECVKEGHFWDQRLNAILALPAV